MSISSMLCAVFFALLGSALAGPIDIEADLKHNVHLGLLQTDLDEGPKNSAAIEAEIELLKAAYAKTVNESPAPLNGSTIDDEDANEMNEKSEEAKGLFEGDMILANDQLALIETSHKSSRSRRQALKAEKSSWGTVNPVIPYSYSANYPKEKREPIITAAMKFWEKNTCVRFEEVASGYRVEIRDGNGCSSEAGNAKNPTGTQALNIGEGCVDAGTILHELQHTFGFYHTHTRFDRDLYVDIDYNNLRPEERQAFNIRKKDKTTLHNIPYEFGSNMHYGHKHFAKNGSKPVIYAKPAYKIYQESMSGHIPTFYDILAVNRHFNCAANCKTSIDCANDGVQDVNNCKKCLCPLGWAGDKCDERPYNTEIDVTSELMAQRIMLKLVNPRPMVYNVKNYVLKAPEGMKVQMTPKAQFAVSAKNCGAMGIEVKFLKDARPAGLRVCGLHEQYPTITSETNEMFVQVYTDEHWIMGHLEFKAVNATSKCKTSIDCAHGGIQDVNNCNKCLCSIMWIGDKCEKRNPAFKHLHPAECPEIKKDNTVCGSGSCDSTLVNSNDNSASCSNGKTLYASTTLGLAAAPIPGSLTCKNGRWTGEKTNGATFSFASVFATCDATCTKPKSSSCPKNGVCKNSKLKITPASTVCSNSTEKCETSVTCANAGVQDVNNCDKCLCPVGWTGDKCDQRVIAVETYLKTRRIYMTKKAEYKAEYYLLKAPEGMKVQMTPKILSAQSSKSCDTMGIEVKFTKDPRPKEYRACKPRMQQPTLTSETNEMLVRAYTQGEKFSVELQFQAVN